VNPVLSSCAAAIELDSASVSSDKANFVWLRIPVTSINP